MLNRAALDVHWSPAGKPGKKAVTGATCDTDTGLACGGGGRVYFFGGFPIAAGVPLITLLA